MWCEKVLKGCFFLILFVSVASLSANQEAEYEGTERIVSEANHKGLAKLMQQLRLSNPYDKETLSYQVWEEQAQFNIPILILASYYLNEFCKTNQKQRLLFSARDCCHLVDIFTALFPKYESIYFYSSRLVYLNPSPAYIEYVRDFYSEHTVIVDGQGTGNSCRDFFLNQFNTNPCLIPIVGLIPNHPAIAYRFGDHIEFINFASHGSLYDYTEDGPKFLPLEYDIESVRPAYACVRKCLKIINDYKFETFDQMLIEMLLWNLKLSKPVLKKFHVINHEVPSDFQSVFK